MGREIKFRVWDGRRMREPKRILFDTSVGTVAVFDEGELRNPHLMQYTGLTDDEGQEIYEGDYYKYPDGDVCVVEQAWHVPCMLRVAGWESTEGRVLGNIYENPKLAQQEAA